MYVYRYGEKVIIISSSLFDVIPAIATWMWSDPSRSCCCDQESFVHINQTLQSIESSKTIDPGQKSIDSIYSVDWIPELFTFHFSGVLVL